MDENISEGLRVSLLPSQMPLWEESIISFTKSGGYLHLASQIPRIKQPTLIIWGERDGELGTEDARKFKNAIAGSQLVWIKEAGHAPQWEKPNEVAEAIRRFVAREI
jgi:pimeloyl-ACP methyl ester carboxylesterase